MTIASCLPELPKSHEEWQQFAEHVAARRTEAFKCSYVDAAQMLAKRVLDTMPLVRDCEQLVDNVSHVQARCTDLLEQRRALAVRIETLAAAPAEDQPALLAELLTVARSCQ